MNDSKSKNPTKLAGTLDDLSPVEVALDTLEGDLRTLFKLVVTHNKPVTDGDVRAASAILRRWLSEGQIGRLCHAIGVSPTFPVFDNASIITAIKDAPDVRYYLTGGVRFNGRPVTHVYASDLPASGKPSLPLGPMPYVLVKTKKFLEQKRVFYDGAYLSCEEIIRFTANKLGGVHLDFVRDERQQLLQSAAQYMTFGGPLERIVRGNVGEMHLALEPEGEEALSGLHIEVMAAASSFLNIHLDGKQLLEFSVKPSIWSRISRRLRIKRATFEQLYDR